MICVIMFEVPKGRRDPLKAAISTSKVYPNFLAIEDHPDKLVYRTNAFSCKGKAMREYKNLFKALIAHNYARDPVSVYTLSYVVTHTKTRPYIAKII